MSRGAMLLRLGLLVAGACGGGWLPERHDWIVPEEVSGYWIAELDEQGPGARGEARYWILEQGGTVTGTYEEFRKDGDHCVHDLTGAWDSAQGHLRLRHERCDYPEVEELFRFTSPTRMYLVSPYALDTYLFFADRVSDAP